MDKLFDSVMALLREHGGNATLFFVATCALAVFAWHQYLRIARQREDLERERLLAARTKEEIARLEARDAAQASGAPRDRRNDGPRASTSRVLVVEDNREMQLIIEALLDKCLSDPVVQVRATPEEAMEELRKFRPELLILDMNLSGGHSGLSVLDYLRQARPDLPVLVYTGYEDQALRVLELRERTGLQHLAVLHKGPDIDAFIQLVPHLFRRRADDRPGGRAPDGIERRERRGRAGDPRYTQRPHGQPAMPERRRPVAAASVERAPSWSD